MTRLSLVMCLLLAACGGAAEECSAKKAIARTAWGEVGVRYAIALSGAEEAVKEPTGRLAALASRPDAPAEGKAALAAEIAEKQGVVDALRPKVAGAQAVSAAFAGERAADGGALAAVTAPTLDGDDVRGAVQRADEAVAACEGVD